MIPNGNMLKLLNGTGQRKAKFFGHGFLTDGSKTR
jgi:hypothetical protein